MELKSLCYTMYAVAFLIVGCASPADKEAKPGDTEIEAITADTTVSPPVATTPFNKSIEWKKTGFSISSPQTASGNTITITPTGLAAVNDPITIDVDGVVVSAVADDLDLDQSAEILVVTKNQSTNWSTGYLFSVNNGKSLGTAVMPDWKADAANMMGVSGNNEFLMMEGILTHRMPLTENGKPNGKWRQFQCKLKNGEASKVVVIDKKMEF